MEKTDMGIDIFCVASIDEYWPRLERSLETLVTVFLRDKREFGTSSMCAEAGIQRLLAYTAQKTAQKHGLDTHKATCVFWAAGLCFPEFGALGMAACERYMKRNAIPWDITAIKIGAIEFAISKSGSIVTPQLDEALHAYYENRTNIPEVNVARYCQIKINESRELMKNGVPADEAIAKAAEGMAEGFSAEKSVMASGAEIGIPIEVQEKINADLEDHIEHCGLPKGIFEWLV